MSKKPRVAPAKKDKAPAGDEVDPVIELIEKRNRDVPPEVQAEMFAQLKKGLDENRTSPRKLFP
jgi:hypothetical protein